jgi:hypothetical protein
MPERNTLCDLMTIRSQRDYRKIRKADYARVFNRVSLARQKSDSEDDVRARYERANHTIQILTDRRLTHTQTMLETCLHEHIERWKSNTLHWSSITRMLAHPSYLRIIGLSRNFTDYEVERALLQELETEPDYWFAALTAITGEDPVRPEYDFDEAVDAWLIWGRKRGII